MSISPNATQTLAPSEEREEGLVDQGQVEDLSLEIDVEEAGRIIGNRLDNAVKYWNEKLKLDEVRERSENYWLNNPYSSEDLYDFQTQYKNNRMFTAIETLVAVVMMQRAEPVVTEGANTDAARQLANDHQDVLRAYYEDEYLKEKGTYVARHLLIGLRLGVLKLRFDPDSGEEMPDGTRKGRIITEVVRPQRIVLAEGANSHDDLPIVGEFLVDTVENLIAKYPKGEEKLLKKLGIVQKRKSQMQKRIGYVECWFTYRDKGSGKRVSAVAWQYEGETLDAIKNPNWNYDEWETDPLTGEQKRLNYADFPTHPYTFFNHLNLGKYIIDDTSLSDQAQPMQDVLNKRGRQIVDNADQAQGGLVINEEQVSQEVAAKLKGDPGEKIMAKGDARTAVTRLPRNSLEAFVLRDKEDARSEIDTLFGANAALRGEDSSADTLGQDVMSQRANMGRVQPLADAMENGFSRHYRKLTQMMKVYFDEDVEMSYSNTDGKTNFVTTNKNKIDPRMKVRVKAGSMIPKDKFTTRKETMELAPILDPLTLAEGLDRPDPKLIAKRIVYYRFAMDKYVSEFLEGDETGQDQQAMTDINMMIQQGQMPQVPPSPSKEYVATIQSFIQSPALTQLPPEKQQMVIQFAQMVVQATKGAMGDAAPEENAPAPTETTGQEAPPAEAAPAAPVPPEAPAGQPGIASRIMGGVKKLIGR